MKILIIIILAIVIAMLITVCEQHDSKTGGAGYSIGEDPIGLRAVADAEAARRRSMCAIL